MHDFFIYLLSIVAIVPLSKYLGLGSVIGYLIAGALIGPQGLSLLENGTDHTSEIAEFGIIMMLLLIGLELKPRFLWKMRGPIFGLGSVQMISTIAIFAIALGLSGTPWTIATVIGMTVSVSSTAISLQTLQEQGYAKSIAGERAFAVLLFQDLAVIPLLAILPFLGTYAVSANTGSASQKALLICGAVVTIIGIGRFVLRPLFKLIAQTKLRETFTALALLIVSGATILMHRVGLSPALGAFLAGVVLADSEFRHQIEADIEPFKGLLLGLFFITIGSRLRFDLIVLNPLLIAQWVFAIIAVKTILIYIIGRSFRLRPPESLLFGVSLAQGGEFAFVLIGQSHGILAPETAQMLTAAIVLSMAFAPLLIKLAIKKGMSKLECVKPTERLPDTVDETAKDNPILVIGIGRFGQTLIRFLRANSYSCTVLDMDSEQIEIMSRFGIKAYFGDGTNIDLLHAAGLDRCKVLVLAIDEPESAIKIATLVRQHRPSLPIFARVYDRLHAYEMLPLGVQEIAIETSGSALALGVEVLKTLGLRADRAEAKAQLFQVNNQRSIHELSKRFHQEDRETFLQSAKQAADELESILRSDPEELAHAASSEWPGKAEPTSI